jgi:hypothetical protein
MQVTTNCTTLKKQQRKCCLLWQKTLVCQFGWAQPPEKLPFFFLSCPWLPKMNHFKPLLRSTACLTRRSVHSTAIVRAETEAATQRKLT